MLILTISHIPVDYQPLTRNNNIDILRNELNISLNVTDESNEAVNNIVVKQLAKTKILTQEIYLKIQNVISVVDTGIKDM